MYASRRSPVSGGGEAKSPESAHLGQRRQESGTARDRPILAAPQASSRNFSSVGRFGVVARKRPKVKSEGRPDVSFEVGARAVIRTKPGAMGVGTLKLGLIANIGAGDTSVRPVPSLERPFQSDIPNDPRAGLWVSVLGWWSGLQSRIGPGGYRKRPVFGCGGCWEVSSKAGFAVSRVGHQQIVGTREPFCLSVAIDPKSVILGDVELNSDAGSTNLGRVFPILA